MRNARFCLISAVLCLAPALAVLSQGQPSPAKANYLDIIRAPSNLVPPLKKRTPVVIAVVDDGVRVTHRDIAPFIWKNPKEVGGNGIDDDGNGCVDDVNGWNVSDSNNIVTPPEGRLKEYHHGTHLAGIIARIARLAYGEAAPEHIRIMPVKVLGDAAVDTYIRDGYDGIAYAIKNGANIILCAWGVGHISPKEADVLKEAAAKGVLVVGAAGNIPDGSAQYPGAANTSLAVAGLDAEGRKMARSNFGRFVGLCAPAEKISSASSSSDDGYEEHDGTSPAAAMVAAAAALIEVQHPSYSPAMVKACLENSAAPVRDPDPRFTAELGAGELDIAAAVAAYPPFQQEGPWRRYKGYLAVSSRFAKQTAFHIGPPGDFKGIWFKRPLVNGDPGKTTITICAGDSPKGRMVESLRLSELRSPVFVAGKSAWVSFDSRGTVTHFDGLIEYETEAIDYATLYCHGTKEINREGIIEDGSGGNGYSPGSDCKWLITAPPGKAVHFKFLKFDTEARVDLLYFFDGDGTEDKIMAIFSGQDIPPEITTWHNKVLVWFVTDGKNQGKGWLAQVTFVDKKN